VAGLAAKFGSGAMSNSVAEIEEARALFVIGSNTTENHPIIALRMKAAVRKGAKLIVADPRQIPLTKFATLWLRHKPGTDSVLLNSIMHVILREGWEDRKFIEERSENFAQFSASLSDFTPEFAEKITGVPSSDIEQAAEIYASAGNAGIYYAMGITQHVMGTNNVHALGNLAILTGNIGKPSSGVNPLRGQNNVQGCCDMGCLPNVYPGYQNVDDRSAREKFETAWGVNLSGKPGLPATEMTRAMNEGNLRALYVFGENPALSDPNSAHTIKGFKRLDFLVVQDIFETETTRLADVVLPSASFAEKRGTFTCSERRVQMVRPAVFPPGEARSDLDIIREIYQRLQEEEIRSIDPREVFDEIGTLWSAVAGMSYERLEKSSLQWPCPDRDHPGTPYLHKNGPSRPGGRAVFSVVPYVRSSELPDNDYPYILTTGRELFHYHTGTMTRRSFGLDAVAPEAFVELNPADASVLQVNEGERLCVSSRRGTITIKARVTEVVPPGVVFIPFHYSEAAANVLTNDALDPVCRIMEAKVCAVQIEKAAADG
jgi:formate dehydrogenase alpha subunit